MTRLINAKYLIRTQHRTRIYFVTGCIVTSFFVIAMCLFYKSVEIMFWVSLLASIIVGIGIALGESVNLGFLKTFPGETIGYYGSGTGMAGITGALIFIALQPTGLGDGVIYMLAIPTAIPYLLCFLWLDRQKKKYPYVPDPEEVQEEVGDSLEASQTQVGSNTAVERATNNTMTTEVSGIDQDAKLASEGVADNLSFTCENMNNVLKKVGFTMAQLSIVYFLEYTITTSFTVACAAQIIDLHPD